MHSTTTTDAWYSQYGYSDTTKLCLCFKILNIEKNMIKPEALLQSPALDIYVPVV